MIRGRGMDSLVCKDWHDLLGPLKSEPYFINAMARYDQDLAAGITCYPPRNEIFNAFRLTEFKNLKVVIIGQDPYHQPGQAMGLAFSVKPGIKTPPSLVNMYKELQNDIPGFVIPNHGCLTHWAEQGVLMLNSILTVQDSKPLSHSKNGWDEFTTKVIEQINNNSSHLVYMLWGSKAKAKCKMVDRVNNLVLEAAHPSPLSAYNGFLGCRHFSKANEYLVAMGKAPIDWNLPSVVSYP